MAVADEQRTGFRGAATPPVDLGHLRRFTMGNIALEREVLQLFVEQAPITLVHLEQAATEKAWRDAAHTLKGSASAIGAHAIARTAAEAELVRGEPGAWPDVLARLHDALREAFAFIQSNAVDAA
jgi:HPt (histidine-containing phosphotransfer) domain-containing protein